MKEKGLVVISALFIALVYSVMIRYLSLQNRLRKRDYIGRAPTAREYTVECEVTEEMFEKAAYSKEELPKYSYDTDSACLTFIA